MTNTIQKVGALILDEDFKGLGRWVKDLDLTSPNEKLVEPLLMASFFFESSGTHHHSAILAAQAAAIHAANAPKDKQSIANDAWKRTVGDLARHNLAEALDMALFAFGFVNARMNDGTFRQTVLTTLSSLSLTEPAASLGPEEKERVTSLQNFATRLIDGKGAKTKALAQQSLSLQEERVLHPLPLKKRYPKRIKPRQIVPQ